MERTLVKRGHDARDIERMVGYVDMHDIHHPGDGVPRLLHFPETGWSLWYLTEHGGQTVLSSCGVPEVVAVRLLAGDSIGRPTGVN